VTPDVALTELVRLPCIGAVAQPETGGDLLLHFGDWQRYADLPHPRVRTVERGSWSLMICCPWRLDGPTAVLCDWRSVADPARQGEQAHLVVEGLAVESVVLSPPGLDLQIQFSRGVRLRVLCDSSGKTDDCWYLLRPDESSVAATREFRLVYEPPELAPGDATETLPR
jgi:hypothetical protein